MLKFYHNFLSPYSRCVWIALHEKKIGVELIPFNPNTTNPFDYIPTLVDDGFEITDPLAILDYLELQYPNTALLPKQAKALATVRMVETIVIHQLLPAIAKLFGDSQGWKCDRGQLEPSEQQILSGLTDLESLLGENLYFGGTQITLAEVVAGTAIPLLPKLGVSLEDFPRLQAWTERLTYWKAWVATQSDWERQLPPLKALNTITPLHESSKILTQTAIASGGDRVAWGLPECTSSAVGRRNQPLPNSNQAQTDLLAITQTFSVDFQYQVHFTKNLFALDNPLLTQVITSDGEILPKRALVVVDGGLLPYYPQLLQQIQNYAQNSDSFQLKAEPLIVPGGEAAKNDPQLLHQIHRAIEQAGLCRHSYLLAIGGGAVLDLVGYAAAGAHRGIRLIRIPTTVLAQNDSGVGVKNGINAFGKKNFLGSFAPPYAVINDVEFLTTLDDRDWRSGVAEAIKVALIRDAEFFHWIAARVEHIANYNLDVMSKLVYRCAQLHLEHIATGGDPFEAGSSRPLDFGHWAAHRLEHLTNYRLRHGEAVAIGIALDCTYAYLQQMLSYSQWQQILKTLSALGFTLYVPELALTEENNSLFDGINEFREHLGGELTLMLLEKIGRGIEVHAVDIDVYQQAVVKLQEFTHTQPQLTLA